MKEKKGSKIDDTDESKAMATSTNVEASTILNDKIDSFNQRLDNFESRINTLEKNEEERVNRRDRRHKPQNKIEEDAPWASSRKSIPPRSHEGITTTNQDAGIKRRKTKRRKNRTKRKKSLKKKSLKRKRTRRR